MTTSATKLESRDHVYAAFLEGVEARLMNLPESSCPYKARSLDADSWELGWGRADHITDKVSEIQEEAMRIVAAPLLERIKQIKAAAKPIVEALESVGNETDWRDGDDTDRVYAWYEIKPLKDAMGVDDTGTPLTEKESEPAAEPTKWFRCAQIKHDGQSRAGRGSFNREWHSPYKIRWDGTSFDQRYENLWDSASGGTIEITEWTEEPVNADS